MDAEDDAKKAHGRQLSAAMAAAGVDRSFIVDATGRDSKTVTNWRRGFSMPNATDRATLRKLFPGYDQGGADDAVEAAVRRTKLIRWRQDDVITSYQRHLFEQDEAERRSG